MLDFTGLNGLRITYPHVLGIPERRQITFVEEGRCAVCKTCKETYERTTSPSDRVRGINVLGELWGPVFSVCTSDPFAAHERMYQHTVLHYLIEDGLDIQTKP